jgi:Type II transport protein GspH
MRRPRQRVRRSLTDRGMDSPRSRPASSSGFSSVELVVAAAITVSVCLFTFAYLHTIVRRERMKAAVREIYSRVLATRMQAVRRDATVVLEVDVAKRELTTWADQSPPNFVRDDSEPVLSVQGLPPFLVLRAVDGSVDGPNSVAFDGYAGDASLVDRIVFRSNGGVVRPEASNSAPPARPGTATADVPPTSVNCRADGCRGIFLSDPSNTGSRRNLFRISVDDFGRVGKVSLLKWLPPEQGGNSGERDFVPPPWKWVN